jgi:hypothetical protein
LEEDYGKLSKTVAELAGERAKVSKALRANLVAQARVDLALDAMTEIDLRVEEAMGPITDPAQGVVTVGIDWAVPGSERTVETIIDHTGTVVSCRERPSCIPADCQHFEQLPSGLWAWVTKDGSLMIEDRGPTEGNWYLTPDMALGADEGPDISSADFLAARALGVRVLGWKA